MNPKEKREIDRAYCKRKRSNNDCFDDTLEGEKRNGRKCNGK